MHAQLGTALRVSSNNGRLSPRQATAEQGPAGRLGCFSGHYSKGDSVAPSQRLTGRSDDRTIAEHVNNLVDTLRAPIFQLDAFTTRRFTGNPAAVVVLQNFPEESVMQAVAAENNLAETAFLVREGAEYRLRWFTPMIEVPLCGHATLASAAVVMERLEPTRSRVVFHSASGPLTVTRASAGYLMNFPARFSEAVPPPPDLTDALGLAPLEVHVNAFNYMAVLESERAVRTVAPDMERVRRLDRSGLIVTAASSGEVDFVSRYFAPAKGVPEDPVTGGAHCMLTPYWAKRLHKSELRAFQASPRGGEMTCRLLGDRVEMEGGCVFYMEGEVEF